MNLANIVKGARQFRHVGRRNDRRASDTVWPLLLVLIVAFYPTIGAFAGDSTSRHDWRDEYRRPKSIPYPDDNPYTKAKATLGRLLFFDPILSGERARSCGSCHNPSLSWTDGVMRGLGENQRPMATHTPTLLNIAWVPVLGWRGQFPDLETVAVTPMTSPNIMNVKMDRLISELRSIPGYVAAFNNAFPGGTISADTIKKALATYERTIVSSAAPFDRWIDGDEKAISDAAKRGFNLFRGKAGCSECHRGWNFTDVSFYDVGVAGKADLGRGTMFPNSIKLRHAFKVPTLRDVARRAPYMHDGSVPTLEAVIDLYDRGGIDRPSRSDLIKPLHLTAQDKADLVAFLKTLTGASHPVEIPELPR